MSEYGALRLINAMVTRYMVGTREVIGRGRDLHAAPGTEGKCGLTTLPLKPPGQRC